MPTTEQVTDGLTKPLCRDKFVAFRKAVGVEWSACYCPIGVLSSCGSTVYPFVRRGDVHNLVLYLQRRSRVTAVMAVQRDFKGVFSSEEWNRGALFTRNGSDTFLDCCHSLATLLYFHLYFHWPFFHKLFSPWRVFICGLSKAVFMSFYSMYIVTVVAIGVRFVWECQKCKPATGSLRLPASCFMHAVHKNSASHCFT